MSEELNPVKRNVAGAAFTTALLLSATALMFVNLATANFIVYLQYITIKSDGSIEPETEFINRRGSLYVLTANLSQNYAVKIQCNNIIFDGKGHIINGTISEGYGYANNGLSLESVTNVTVKNLEVTGFMDHDIFLKNCSKCSILNLKAYKILVAESNFINITESVIGNAGLGYIMMRLSNNNMITRSNITSIDVGCCDLNKIFANNFLSNNSYHVTNSVASWDNGSVGNYWSDYVTKYPKASEIGNTGIGDTPYVIDADNIDNFPLMAPFVVSSPSSPEPEPAPEPFPTELAAVASGVSIAAVAVCLLYYHKKRIIKP